MSKINTDWYADEVATDLNRESDLSQYIATVERDVETKALIEGVRIDEIPLDDDGYYSSRIFISYAVLLYKKHLFMGYWGSSRGNDEDIYKVKLDEIKKWIKEIEPKITRESILGLATEAGDPKGKQSVVRSIPMFNGAPRG